MHILKRLVWPKPERPTPSDEDKDGQQDQASAQLLTDIYIRPPAPRKLKQLLLPDQNIQGPTFPQTADTAATPSYWSEWAWEGTTRYTRKLLDICKTPPKPLIPKLVEPAKITLKDQLAEAQARTPRFLFRGWNNTSGMPSGGCQDLNNPGAITPMAYLNRTGSEVLSIFDQPKAALIDMLTTHLHTEKTEHKQPTQFSSWASSLPVAFEFSRGGNYYISVFDTQMLRGKNFVAYVPALEFFENSCKAYHWEYLIHGVIEGVYYQAVPQWKFEKIDFPYGHVYAVPFFIPHSSEDKEYVDCFPELSEHAVKRDREDALSVGRLYGTHFEFPVFLGIVCAKLRYPDMRSDQARTRKELEGIVAFVNKKESRVPLDWCTDESIMVNGVVNTVWYVDVRAILLCMRLLVVQRYPEEVRKRWPALEKERMLKDDMVEVQRP